jgi:hypothetical protein
MADLKQFRSPDLSLWQSAADEVVTKHPKSGTARALDVGGKPVSTGRPPQDDNMIADANAIAEAIDQGMPAPATPADVHKQTEGVGDVAKFCSTAAFHLAQARVKAVFTGDDSEVKKFNQELGTKFGNCDPRWVDVVEKYVAFKTQSIAIPYRTHTATDNFVRTLPEDATVALIADWGTGEDTAKRVLNLLAAKKPDVVIHLGDVYYSGTDHEMDTYFYDIWQQTFHLPLVESGAKLTVPSTPLTYTLAGNHDMYSGGAPYYALIDRLGQPASYFCLRSANWQFIALDTGFFDSNPVAKGPTKLHDSEAEWLKQRVAEAPGLKTVLLSHHQLFTAYEQEKPGPDAVNASLMAQVASVLPNTTVWFWGHEHNLTVFKTFQGVLARCIGHGSFPVGVDQPADRIPGVPIDEDKSLKPDAIGGLFSHGYVLMRLTGKTAKVSYFVFDGMDETEFTEDL